MTAPNKALTAIQKVVGNGAYQAYAGCCTWLNGVYWIRILQERKNGDLLIENLHDIGKIKIQRVQAVIEPDLVFPLIRGRDVHRWSALPSTKIILTQDPDTRRGIPEEQMKRKYPKTFAFLRQFEEVLRKRSGYRQYFKPHDPFYCVYNVGPYSMVPYKVVWAGEVATSLDCAVVQPDGERIVLNDQTVYQVPFDERPEAFYFAGLMNSLPVRAFYKFLAYKHTSMNFIKNIRISKYRAGEAIYMTLSELSSQCHNAAAKEDLSAISVLQDKIDSAAAKLWSITAQELECLREQL